MFNNRESREHKLERLNIVPIMDAVFIFIFFLLFSAQFIKIFEIEMDAPIVSDVPDDKKIKEDPLNLKIKIYKSKIEVITGLDEVLEEIFFKRDTNYKTKVKKLLVDLRVKHPKDDYAIISPLPNIRYDEIVEVIDLVQTIPEGTKVEIVKDGEQASLRKIFSQVVLEPMNEI